VHLRTPALLAVVALSLAACGSSDPPGGRKVSKADFGDAWPFTVDSGTLYCKGSSTAGAVTLRAGGKDLRAQQHGEHVRPRPRLTPIWADDPTSAGSKKSINPLITAGLRLCG